MTQEKQLSPIDVHVGNRLRVRRTFLHASQQKLGQQLGISFQQIQKFEKGQNRISVAQLFEIAKFLKVEPNFFYEGLAGAAEPGFAEVQSQLPSTGIEDTVEGMALNRAFARIRNAKVRRRIIELVTAVADSSSAPSVRQNERK